MSDLDASQVEEEDEEEMAVGSRKRCSLAHTVRRRIMSTQEWNGCWAVGILTLGGEGRVGLRLP